MLRVSRQIAGKSRLFRANELIGWSQWPEIPTIAETVPGFDVFSWFGFFVPAKTPPDVIAKINADTNAALAYAPVKLRFEDLGAVPKGSTPSELAAFLKSETDKWGPVIKEARIKVEN